jgi:hypothetical protein
MRLGALRVDSHQQQLTSLKVHWRLDTRAFFVLTDCLYDLHPSRIFANLNCGKVHVRRHELPLGRML